MAVSLKIPMTYPQADIRDKIITIYFRFNQEAGAWRKVCMISISLLMNHNFTDNNEYCCSSHSQCPFPFLPFIALSDFIPVAVIICSSFWAHFFSLVSSYSQSCYLMQMQMSVTSSIFANLCHPVTIVWIFQVTISSNFLR